MIVENRGHVSTISQYSEALHTFYRDFGRPPDDIEILGLFWRGNEGPSQEELFRLSAEVFALRLLSQYQLLPPYQSTEALGLFTEKTWTWLEPYVLDNDLSARSAACAAKDFSRNALALMQQITEGEQNLISLTDVLAERAIALLETHHIGLDLFQRERG